MTADELQATIERVEAKRRELTNVATRTITGDGAKIISLLPKAAEYCGQQIALGLDGDPRAAAKALPSCANFAAGKFSWSLARMARYGRNTACICLLCFRPQEHLVGVSP